MDHSQRRAGAMEGQREWNSSALASPGPQRRANQHPIAPFEINSEREYSAASFACTSRIEMSIPPNSLSDITAEMRLCSPRIDASHLIVLLTIRR